MIFDILNDVLLSVFLFLFYLSIAATILSEAGLYPETDVDTPDYKSLFSEQYDPEPDTDEPVSSDEIQTVSLSIFTKLKQSHLRKLCRPLGIDPMIEGKWLSTSKMRQIIQQVAQEYPQKFMDALQAKLPEFTKATAIVTPSVSA